MITKLTKDQTAQIAVYRDRYWQQAISTAPVDRPRAVAAAQRMAEIGGVKVNNIIWVTRPKDGAKAYEENWTSLWDSLRTSLSDSLWDSLRTSLWTSLRTSLRTSLSDSPWGSLRTSLRTSLSDSLWGSLRTSLRDSLSDSLWTSLRTSLWTSLRDSLRTSLRTSLSDSLWDSLRTSLSDSPWTSLRTSLRDSLWDSLSDSNLLCYYTYVTKVLGILCSDQHRELLRLHNEIAASCFALWIIPGTIILCERPKSVTLDEIGKNVINLEWQ
jgi:hypothetical protein